MGFGHSVLKSIQRGVIAMSGTSATATITAVDVDKSVLIWGGSRFNHATAHDERAWNTMLVFTNSTTITASRNSSVDDCQLPFQVVEYN